MRIPLVDLKANYLSIKAEVDEAIASVLERGDFIQGQDVKLLEQEFAAYCSAREAVGVSSGTDALVLALMALNVGKGDEVITTPFTFIATAEAISQVGATPVFADIDPRTCNINAAKIAEAITPRTKAILPVHLYGRPAEMGAILRLARRHNLYVIEDAAQAHGAAYEGRRVGSLGDVACFSFYPAKNLGAFGDAGMVVTSNPKVADRVRLLRDHGRRDKYRHVELGVNARLDTLQAAVLRVKLRCLDAWNQRRRAVASLYRRLLVPDLLALPPEDRGSESVYHMFVVRTPFREALRQKLQDQGIETGIHYPVPLHLQPAYSALWHRAGDFPESERAAGEVLSLPMFPDMTPEQVKRVALAVTDVLQGLQQRQAVA